MADLIKKIIAWLWKKLVLLAILIVILVAALWVRKEARNITEDLKEADKLEAVANGIDESLAPQRSEYERLSAEVEELSKKLATQEGRVKIAEEGVRLAKAKYEKIEDQERFYMFRWNPAHKVFYAKLDGAAAAVKEAQKVLKLAKSDWNEIKTKLEGSPAGKRVLEIKQELDEKESQLADLRDRIGKKRGDAESRLLQRMKRAIVEVLPTAIFALLGIIFIPLALKSLVYFCIAPLASKAKPVSLYPEASGALEVGPSEISIPINIEQGQSVLVHSHFLQASSDGAGKRLRWLFSWKYPLTSLAAGLYAMNEVRNKRDEPETITISPKKSYFDRVSVLKIPEGSSAVIYPRSLVGIILENNEHVHIDPQWRIWNLHSWLTLQFRYIVIHGRAQLVVKGCRGIRGEQVTRTAGRKQDAGATLGFTSNLNYSSERCETFWDYVWGRDELFNDRFSGSEGIHLTEEIPDESQRNTLFSRGLEGILDGFLKAFGI
ncbi:MAG: hypothetical protein ACSHX9_00090 [Luteolibacter sp.]